MADKDLSIKITTKNGAVIASDVVENSQNACFEFIGKVFKQRAEEGMIPETLLVETSAGNASYALNKRGTYVRNSDGATMPSMFVVEHYNNIITMDESPDYKEKYLTCVNFGSNNYKYYWLKPGPNGIDATYGRIGAKKGEMFGEKSLDEPYPEHMYWIRYYEKLSKGYEDSTDIYLNEETVDAKTTDADDSQVVDVAKTNNAVVDAPSMALYRKLKACSRQYVQDRVSISTQKITSAHFEACTKSLKELYDLANGGCSVDAFNNQLRKLLMIVPRPARFIEEAVAHSSKDFAKVLDREQTLVNAMQCLVADHVALKTEDGFGSHNIKVYEATDKQKEEVLKKLPANLASCVKHVYRVIPEGQKAKFNQYLEDNHIHKVKQFWHGSRTENWFSIILNSLQLSPDAVTTGKMFGQGIYFAPSAQKSWGYTSGRGSYWAHGRDNTSYMGLFATAYGHPYDVNSALGSYFNKSGLPRGTDCVHAHAGTQLRNDEVIFYDESAVLLNYIVEFEN